MTILGRCKRGSKAWTSVTGELCLYSIIRKSDNEIIVTYNALFDCRVVTLKHGGVFAMPFFTPRLPFSHPIWKLLHPGKEFDEIVAGITSMNKTLSKVIDTDDQRMLDGMDGRGVVDGC